MWPISIVTFLAILSPSLAVLQDAVSDERAFVAWATENAIQLDSLDGDKIDPSTFDFLDEALEGKRIVYLGEMDHFVAERMEFRLLLIRELAQRGYRRIGMEMGLSDAKRMDRFLATGDETWLDRVALYGYRADLRDDRSDEVAGWTDDRHPEFTRTVLEEARWFITQLREINEEMPEGEPRLKWFGYDLGFRPGGGYADAAELLNPHEEQALVSQVMQQMARVPGETRLEEASRLESIVNILDERGDEIRAMLGQTGALDLRRSLQRMADAFRFIDSLQGLGEQFDAEAIAEALSKREARMAHNFDEHLAEWPPDEKVILLGHALHLSKDSESIDTRDFGLMWESIGTYLNRKLPGEVYGFWLLHNRGMHGQARSIPSVQPFHSPEGAVERLLAEIHPMLMLPLASEDPRRAWLDERRVFSHSGAAARAVLTQQVDCLFFVEQANEPGKRREQGQ